MEGQHREYHTHSESSDLMIIFALYTITYKSYTRCHSKLRSGNTHTQGQTDKRTDRRTDRQGHNVEAHWHQQAALLAAL